MADLDKDKKTSDKDKKIKKEKARLKRIFKNVDENKLQILDGVMDSVAFMRGTLAEMERSIIDEGYDDVYQNGANQTGSKASPAAMLHLSMTKNYLAAIKILVDCAPLAERRNSKLAAMRDE